MVNKLKDVIGFRTVFNADINGVNEEVGDLYINSLGDLGYLKNTTSSEKVRATIQGIGQRLKQFRGEWFMNLLEGVPYFQEILIKNPDIPIIRGLIYRAIITYPGIVRVDELTLDFDKSARSLTISFNCTLDDGTLVKSEDYQPLILNLSNR